MQWRVGRSSSRLEVEPGGRAAFVRVSFCLIELLFVHAITPVPASHKSRRLAGPTPPHKPKAQAHEDARVLSIRIARLVVGTPPLTLSLISSVRLPVEDRPVARPHEGLGLLVEHRKHIVALCRGALPSLPFEKDE